MIPKPGRYAVALWAMLATYAFTGCLEGKKISDLEAPPAAAPPRGSSWIIPTGVGIDAKHRGALESHGLYASTDPHELCCWLAPSARITFAAPRSAVHAVVSFLVPQYPFFYAQPQAIVLRVGAFRERYADLVPGVHRIGIDLPEHGNAATLEVTSERTFVPARERINSDTRALGIVLLSVAYR